MLTIMCHLCWIRLKLTLLETNSKRLLYVWMSSVIWIPCREEVC